MDRQHEPAAGEEWGLRLTGTVIAAIQARRKELDLDVADIADRCAQLGYDFPKHILFKLLSGKRPKLTVPELVILAAALETPLPLLLAPMHLGGDVETTPGQPTPTAYAFRWFSGEKFAVAHPPWRDPARDRDVVRTNRLLRWYGEYTALLSSLSMETGALMAFRTQRRAAEGRGDRDAAQEAQRKLDELSASLLGRWHELRQRRLDMSVEGWEPPPLPHHLQSNLEIGLGLPEGHLTHVPAGSDG